MEEILNCLFRQTFALLFNADAAKKYNVSLNYFKVGDAAVHKARMDI